MKWLAAALFFVSYLNDIYSDMWFPAIEHLAFSCLCLAIPSENDKR